MGLISWIVNALRTHNQLPAPYTLDYVFSTSLLVYMLLTSPVVTRMLVYNVMKYDTYFTFCVFVLCGKIFSWTNLIIFGGTALVVFRVSLSKIAEHKRSAL